jgi:hypothetical protein
MRSPTRDDFDFNTQAVADRVAQRLTVTVQPPKDFRVERHGDQLVLIVIDRGRVVSRMDVSGADHYDFYWAEDVDVSTQTGIDAGAARATKIGDVDRVWIEDREIAFTVSSDKFKSGYFYAFGANGLGDRSVRYLFSGKQTTEILDSTIPANVDNFSVSESGEVHNGTTVSAISFGYVAPASASFAGVQFFLENYPNPGQVTEYYVDRYIGPAKGASSGKFTALPCRRKGLGTITISGTNVTGVSGTQFTAQVAVGDVIEAFGVTGVVQNVTNDFTITLTATWAGRFSPTNITEWTVIGKVTLYAVSLSKASTHGDYKKAPSTSTLFDAELSAPIAPTLSATSIGNGIRLSLTPAAGTELSHWTIYKAKGAAIPFTDVSIHAVKVVKQDTLNVNSVYQTDDLEFSVYDREQGQTFSYYATATNTRGQEGSPSARAEAVCRLNTDKDTDPSIPSSDGFKNLLFNGFIGGTGNTVGGTANVVSGDTGPDTTQDTFNNIRSNDGLDTLQGPQTQAGIGAGTSRLRAWSRWNELAIGGATVHATHINTNEVKLPAPGVGKSIEINEWILAWNTATQKDKKIKKGGYYTLQVLVYTDATVSGSFIMGVAQYNGGASQWSYLRTRNTDDSINETLNPFSISGFFLGQPASSNPAKLYAAFRLDPTFATDKIAVVLRHADSTAGNIFIKEAMLNENLVTGPWTGDMGNIDMCYPTGSNNPGTRPDHDGTKTGKQI